MSAEKPTKSVKRRKKNAAKEARNAAIIGRVAAGEKQGEIAREMGLHPGTVSEIVNSDEAKHVRDLLRQGLLSLGGAALETFQDALKQRLEFGQMGHAVRVATTVLKEHGAITEDAAVKVEVKPVIIRRRNGEEIVLTAGSGQALGAVVDEDEN